MNINLPYKIGTILKTTVSGNVHYDKIHKYIIGNNEVKVILVLDYKTAARFSIPINLERLEKNWEIC